MMKGQLYLTSLQRTVMKKQLKQIYDMYYERIASVFANPEEETDKYLSRLSEEVNNSINFGGEGAPDPSSYQEAVWEEGLAYYEMLSSMKYRTLGMWIICLCQVWEQQLLAFILHEAQQESIVYDEKQIVSGFPFVSSILDWYGIDYKAINNGKIEEMRDLVNTLKHGAGRSEESLRVRRPDYFTRYGSDTMKYKKTTLLDPTIQMNNKDFDDYWLSLDKFWDEFPERSYSKEDIPPYTDEV